MAPCWTLRGESGEMCELLHTSAVVQKMQRGQKTHGTSDYLHVGDEKAPTIKGRGKFKQSGTGDQFGPSHSAFTGRAEPFFVAGPMSGHLFISAKDLFVAAIDGKGPDH